MRWLNGMRYVDIRPMLDPLGTKADTWLPIRPGTDCALALAFLHVIIGEQLYDKHFVSEWCHGFDELAGHVRQFTPEWAAPITGLSVEQIRETARLIAATQPTFIMMGNGVGDQTTDGTSTVQAISLIAAVTGNLGVPGGNNAPPPGAALFPPMSRLEDLRPPDIEDKLVAPESPVWYQKTGWTECGPTSAYYKGVMSVLTGEPYPLRVLGAGYTNPLSATRNPRKVAEALRKLDFMFVMDVSHGPHVDFADIVLPACTSYEQDLYFGNKGTPEGTWVCGYNQVVEPLGESQERLAFLPRSSRPPGVRGALLERGFRGHDGRDAGPLWPHGREVAAEPRRDTRQESGDPDTCAGTPIPALGQSVQRPALTVRSNATTSTLEESPTTTVQAFCPTCLSTKVRLRAWPRLPNWPRSFL